jgi:hypothetical protein
MIYEWLGFVGIIIILALFAPFVYGLARKNIVIIRGVAIASFLSLTLLLFDANNYIIMTGIIIVYCLAFLFRKMLNYF